MNTPLPEIPRAGLNTALLKACHRNDLTEVLRLLNEGANPQASEAKETPLIIAAQKGFVPLAALLLERGAFVDGTACHYMNTPLHYAAAAGHVSMVHLLLDHGANLHAKEYDARQALHLALENGQGDAASVLMVKAREIQMTRLLLQYGADPNLSDKNGETPLHRASANGHTGIVHLLLEHAACSNPLNTHAQTPLHVARTPQIAELLLQHGGDAAHAAGSDQAMLQHYGKLREAALDHDLEKVRQLLDEWAEIDCRHSGDTPLHFAAQDAGSLIPTLLEWGLDINAQNHAGETPLARAVKGGNHDVVQLLLERGADVHLADKEGHLPIDWATDMAINALLYHYETLASRRDNGTGTR